MCDDQIMFYNSILDSVGFDVRRHRVVKGLDLERTSREVSEELSSDYSTVHNILTALAPAPPEHPVTEEDVFRKLCEMAEKGDVTAQCKLGMFYLESRGTPVSYEMAAEWFSKAASQGDVESMCRLGAMYEDGIGVLQSKEEADRLYKMAMDTDKNLAESFLDYGTASDKVFGSLYRGTETQSVDGQIMEENLDIGKMYESIGAYALAFREYRRAKVGNSKARIHMAQYYEEGKGVKQSYKKAFDQYRIAAESGDAKAQCIIAQMYMCGEGVEKSIGKSIGWYKESAGQGDAEAQFALATAYLAGAVVPRDPEKALSWMTKAACNEDAIAQFCLGEMYEEGDCVERSYESAFEWYGRSADLGALEATVALGRLYHEGKGVPQSDDVAKDYLEYASEQGNEKACELLKEYFGNCQ